MSKRIVFTGGSGKAGRHVVPYLLDQGHQVFNLDLVPLKHPGVNTLVTDLTAERLRKRAEPFEMAVRDWP